MTKPNEMWIRLIAGATHGQTPVQGRARSDTTQSEGFDVGPGEIGANVLTEGLDLLALPTGTRLHLSRFPGDR